MGEMRPPLNKWWGSLYFVFFLGGNSCTTSSRYPFVIFRGSGYGSLTWSFFRGRFSARGEGDVATELHNNTTFL